VKNPDYIIPVEMEGRTSNIYVLKRPCVDYFLQQVAKYFEVIIYTASISKYADPLMD
jgi:RNA polymerase II subunit A small phosphatase-like protein